jgi:undecaprenyl-diphosphatase
VLEVLAELDRSLLDATQELRWAPATAVFVVASAWWVKGLVFLLAGVVADLRARRRLPVSAVGVLIATGLATILTDLFKALVGRSRPPIAHPQQFDALISIPQNSSFPSGHASMAFAGAVALGCFHPRLRWPALVLAAAVAVSRPYLGVHFWFDILAGAAFGALLGLAGAELARRLAQRPPLARRLRGDAA